MDTKIVTFSVTDLRHRTTEVLRCVAEQGFAYLLRHSKPKAAVVDIDYLNALQEAYEDYLDTLEFDRTIRLKRMPLAEHMRRRAKRS